MKINEWYYAIDEISGLAARTRKLDLIYEWMKDQRGEFGSEPRIVFKEEWQDFVLKG